MRLVVVGGDAAGGSAASNAKRRDPSLDVVMFERGDWTSYSACGFPYVLGGLVEPWERLVARSPEQHAARGIDVRIRTEITAIDTQRQRVHWREVDGGREGHDGYDRLVYATGAGERRPPIPGLELGLFVQTPEQARAIGARLDGVQPDGMRHAVVVGGGYIGLEMAESLRMRDVTTELLTDSGQVPPTLDPEMAAHVQRALEDVGVHVRLNTPLQSIEAHDGRYALNTPDGTISTDPVILGLGSRPRAGLAQESGIALGATGAVAVDHEQRTNVDGVYAAGDCAEAWHLVSQRWVNFHLGTVANKSGRVAGINAGGGRARFPGVAGTAVSRICAYEVARTGVTEREAAAAGIAVRSEVIEASTRVNYMPDVGPIWVKLITEEGSERVVGGQIVGGEGAGKRIDTIAMAVTLGLTLQQMVDMDLAYAPQFSPVWDPVQTAARVLL